MGEAKVRPLLVREGARYTCFGDGLCCTDMHALGPLTRSEVVSLRLHASSPELSAGRPADPVERNEHLRAPVLRTADGRCVFREDDGCAIHRVKGEGAKPSSCRGFPYRLIATPHGGRVVTEHRCPCRTLGDRKPIERADAERSLRDERGRLRVDLRVAAKISLTATTELSFDSYATEEAVMRGRLARGEDPLDVLDAAPFSPLDAVTWIDVAHHFRSRLDGTGCSVALAWFGDRILERETQIQTRSQVPTPDRRVAVDSPEGRSSRALRERPWAPAFDRAQSRSPVVGDPRIMLADWVADVLWSLDWVGRVAFDRERAELATRVWIARDISCALTLVGVRDDRAMAEAITVVELAGASPLWWSVVRAMT